MKQSLIIGILSLLLSFSINAKSQSVYALFSPHQGEEAFDKIYQMIGGAEDYAHLAIYSWSDSKVDKAIIEALNNGAEVRVVLHPPLAPKASIASNSAAFIL